MFLRIHALFLSISIAFLFSSKAYSSHLFGADLKYEYISSSGNNHTYRITFIAYGDCSGSAFTYFNTSNPQIHIYKDGVAYNANSPLTLPMVAAESNIEITPVCPDEAGNTACSYPPMQAPPTALPGIKKFTYSNTVVLNGTAKWMFIFSSQFNNNSIAGRSEQIQNLSVVGYTNITATLNNNFGQNSSPDLTAPPTPFFCVGEPSLYSLGAADPENDLLHYSFTSALEGLGLATVIPSPPNPPAGTSAYLAPYTPTEPFPYEAGTFTFSNVTGQMEFTPENPSTESDFKSIVALKVSEIRNGDTIGSTMREMTFVFLNDCQNASPLDSLGGISNAEIIDDNGEEYIQTCEGQSGVISFDITAKDPDGDNIKVTWSNLPSGATASVINDSTNNPTFTFNWNVSYYISAGDYTFYVTFSDDGCPLSKSVTIAKTIRILPFEGGLLPGHQSPCQNSSNGYAWIEQISSDTNNYHIVWINDLGDTLRTTYSNKGDTLFNLEAGIYQVIATNEKGCGKKFEISLLEPQYNADFTVSDTSICVHESISFTNLSNELNEFVWDFGDGNSSVIEHPTHTFVTPGTYRVLLVGFNNLNCIDSAEIWITVDSIYPASFSIDKDSLCAGEEILFTPDVGNGVDTVFWEFGTGWEMQTGSLPFSKSFEYPGQHQVTMRASYPNCPDQTDSRLVHLYPYPHISLGSDSFLCLGAEPLLLKNISGDDLPEYRYQWSTGATTPSIEITAPGEYSLYVTSRFNCVTKETIKVSKDCYIDIPNSFTPNGDGLNDYFFPRQLLTSGMASFHMQVFNRWGQLMFESQKADGRGWDGTVNGKEQPLDVYIYNIEVVFENGKVEKYTGNVTLIR